MPVQQQPRLIVVAGPNGAGKSTFSSGLSSKGTIIYDSDKAIQRISDKFPDLPVESIHFHVNNDFYDHMEVAWNKKRISFWKLIFVITN